MSKSAGRTGGTLHGNKEHLREFLRLVASPPRSPEREAALHAWETFKLAQQKAFTLSENRAKAKQAVAGWRKDSHRRSVLRRVGSSRILKDLGRWNKGDYQRSLIARVIDLRGATFTDVCLGYADLRGVLFDGVTFANRERAWSALKGARLTNATLVGAQLPGMRLMDADLQGADLSGANLAGANLQGANLQRAILRDAELSDAQLERANLVGANVEGCRMDRARVYGVSAWDLHGSAKSSRDLVLTPADAPRVTADDIRVAQFVYLMINNPTIRDVLDTVTKKVVLLLGRFKPERKEVLDDLRNALRERNLVPVLFDFEPLADRDLTETIGLLARLARFVIADLTEPSSIPQELQAIAPDVQVPIRLVIADGHQPYAMSRDLAKFDWVIKPYRYRDRQHLLDTLGSEVIDVAEAKRAEIARRRAASDW